MDHLKQKFIHPEAKYTPYPFWFWNGELSKKEIKKQIIDFYDKGINGFVLHPRIGIPKRIPYLSDLFFDYVIYAVELAKELEMTVILYDEGMYPSGSANGQVVSDHPEFASKGIYVVKKENFIKRTDRFQRVLLAFDWNGKSNSVLTGDEYYLVHEDSMGTIRGIHFGEDDGEKDAPRSTDLLDRTAIQYFMTLTHERYFEKLGEHFGNTVIGFFTDEPDILGRNHPEEMLPYNDDLQLELDKQNIHLEKLPLLFLGNKVKNLKKQYQSVVTTLMEKSYYAPISEWCVAKELFLTGHPHNAHDIGLLKYFQVPGQDVVWRWIAPENELGVKGYESVTAKSSSDAARHGERERNLNECFGCCGLDNNQWSFSADEMKWYLDWLFIRGVNLIVPHAFFYSLEHKRMEDRAPDVGRNNLWWQDYRYFSDYIKRMSYMMSHQVNQTNIAVLCEKTFLPYEEIETLYQNQIEFNYLEDTYLIEDKFSIETSYLSVAEQRYKTLIVDVTYPNKELIKLKLTEFVKNGGELIFLEKDKKFSKLIPTLKTIYNNNCMITGGDTKDIRYTEFIKEKRRFYALSNEGEKAVQLQLTFLKEEQVIEIWQPWEGTSKLVSLTNSVLEIELPRRTVLYFTAPLDKDKSQLDTLPQLHFSKQLTTAVTTNHSELTTVGSWTETHSLKHFSGTITYNLYFERKELQELNLSEILTLDLGEVKNMASLLVDGDKRGTRFFAPYKFEITKKELMESKISIEVTNTLSNRYDKSELTSGLLEQPIVLW